MSEEYIKPELLRTTIKEMWEVIQDVHRFPDDFVKAIEWSIKTISDKEKNPSNSETLLYLMIGNLGARYASWFPLKPENDHNYYRMYARQQILEAWCICIARAKSRDSRRYKKDRTGWRRLALWGIPKRCFDVWRLALKYKSELIWGPAYLRKEELKPDESLTTSEKKSTA